MAEIQGWTEPRFAGVRAAFEQNFEERDEVGAAITVLVGGRTVVDLWGGSADAAGTRPWQRDTLVNVWSTTKGVVALAVHLLADRGRLDLEAPVAEYWPEFAAAGKQDITVRQLLCHRAGLSGLREPQSVEDLCDWELTTARLAATEPWWEPGTVSGYHAFTWGHLVGEVVRRVSGLLPGDLLRKELTGPLDLDFHLGLPAAEDHRVAELVQPPPPDDSAMAELFGQLHPAAVAALANPMVTAAEGNLEIWRRAQIPAANGHATARAVAALYGIAAFGGRHGDQRVLSPEAIERGRTGQGACVDLVLGAGLGGAETEFALGWGVGGARGSYGPNPRAFGHDGYGGSFGLADPENGVAAGYVMNRMGQFIIDDPRKMALVAAIYAAV